MYYIHPLNEGQELNYSEVHEGSLATAKERAQHLTRQLTLVLTHGRINVAVVNAQGKTVYETKRLDK